MGAVGILVLLLIAWAVSSDRRAALNWRILLWGLLLPLVIAVIALRTPVGARFFTGVNAVADAFIGFTEEGTAFVFGRWPAVTVVAEPAAGRDRHPAGGGGVRVRHQGAAHPDVPRQRDDDALLPGHPAGVVAGLWPGCCRG